MSRHNYADGGAIFAQFPRPRPLTVKEAARLPDQALRGLIAGTAGLPGDLEGLGRMLINLTGDRVSPDSALPTTEFYQEYLPGRADGDTANIISGTSALFGGAGSTKAARALNNGVNRAAGALSRMPAHAYANGGTVGYTNFGYSNPFGASVQSPLTPRPVTTLPPRPATTLQPGGPLTQINYTAPISDTYYGDYSGAQADAGDAAAPGAPGSVGASALGGIGANVGAAFGGALGGAPGAALGGALGGQAGAIGSGQSVGTAVGNAAVGLGLGAMGLGSWGGVASAALGGNAPSASNWGGAIGGTIGTALGGPLGGVIGSAIGQWGGNAIGAQNAENANQAKGESDAAAVGDAAQAAAADASSASLGGVEGGSNSSTDASSADATNGADAQSDAASASNGNAASAPGSSSDNGIGTNGDGFGGDSAGVGAGASSGWGGGGAGSGVGADSYGGSSASSSSADAGGSAGGADAGGDGCYITTATELANGKADDDAYELKTLRRFREEFMMKDPGLAELVSRYEMMAPSVVAGIKARPDASELFKGLHKQFIAPASRAVSRGDNNKALNIYADMLAHVAPLAEPMLQDPTPAIELGQQAAQVAELTE